MSVASPAILSKFFGEQGRQNNPQYLSGFSRGLFPTTFLETAVNKETKTAIADCWKRCSCCLFKIESHMQSLTTTFSEKYKTSEAKFNEKRQNLDSDSKNGKQTYTER